MEPAPGIRLVWDRRLVESYARGESEDGWTLEGRLGEEFETVRVLTAAGAEGGLLLLAAASPSGADGHDSDRVAALLGGPDGSLQPVEEALISTEYASGRRPRRVGLELHMPGEDYATRAAGDAIGHGESDRGEAHVRFTDLDFRLDGQRGQARFDLLSPRQ